MAAEIELKKINEYVQECLAITSITGSYVYGIDSNGNSIKIAVEVLASAGTDYSQQIEELTTKCNNNTTLITALQSAVNGKANAVHTHQQSDITGLTTALEGKAAASHTHAQSDVTGLTAALNGKADAVHGHSQSDISGLSDALNGKAAAVHTHQQSDIVGLEAALANKSDTDHTHDITDVDGLQNSLANINSRIDEIDGGGAGNALRQEDLNTYTDAKSGDVIQNLGDDTAALQKYFIYECTEGSTVKTITAGTRCLRLVQGSSVFISDQEVDASTTKFILYYRPTVDGVTYNFFGFATLGDTERAKLVGTYVVTDGGETFQITDVTASGNNITAIVLDNGVTLPIDAQTPTRSTQALLTFYASNGVEYYGTVGDCTLCSKDIVSNVAGTQSYLIATQPIGTLFGAQTEIFTASEDIVFKLVTWTQRNVQPETSVASGDAFLSQTDGAIGSTISIYYNSTNQHLELKGNNGAVVAYVDMAVFIKDGMLENVEKYTTPEQGVTVAVPYLKFTFNTDSGKSVIRISFADLIDTFDGSNVDLTSAFVKAATYSAPAIGDSMDVAIGKLLKGHEDNAAAISEKQDTLTFDSTPKANSNNPVTSGGLYNELRITATAIPQDVDWTTLQMVNNDSYYRILPGSYAGKFVRLVNLPTNNMPIIYMLKSEWAASPSKVAYICSANRAMGIRSFYNQAMTIAVFQDSLRKYTINTEFTENNVDYIGPLEAETFTPSTTYSLKQFVELLNSSQEDMQVIIDGKQPTITGAASSITNSNLTASKVLGSDANGKVAATSIATTDAEDAVSKRHTQNTDTQIVSGNNKVEVSASGTAITGNGSVSGNLSISGNLNVTGKETVTEIVHVESENDTITLRKGAQTAIASGSLSGTKVENYDGLGNDLLFGTDASGTFRIGDEGGTLEPIATRDEANNLIDGQLMKWDAANQRLIGISPVPVGSGGTGASTVRAARTNLMDSLAVDTNDFSDSTPIVARYASPTSANGAIYTRTASKLWEYIRTKIFGSTLPSDKFVLTYDATNDQVVGISDIRTNTINGAPLSNAASYFYGVSTSAANATQKEVSIPSITTLNAGQVIVIKPTTSSNRIENATLKLNDFTAYPIDYAANIRVDALVWGSSCPSTFVFTGTHWLFVCRGIDTSYSTLNVEEGTTGTSTGNRVVRADYLQQIIHGQIDKFVGTRAMTEDAYWDLVTAGTVQADTLYITYDNDWEG